MKDSIRTILFLSLLNGVLSLGLCAQSVDSVQRAQQYMHGLYEELIAIEEKITTPADADYFESKISDNVVLMETFFTNNQTLITEYQQVLFSVYSNHRQLAKDIERKIDKIKEEEQSQKEKEKIAAALADYHSEFRLLENSAKQYVSSKEADSLKKIQTKSLTSFNEINSQYLRNKEIVDSDEELKSLFTAIKSSHEDISNMTVVSLKGRVGEILFKIVIVLAVFIFIINMIKTKMQFKKHLKHDSKTPSL